MALPYLPALPYIHSYLNGPHDPLRKQRDQDRHERHPAETAREAELRALLIAARVVVLMR